MYRVIICDAKYYEVEVDAKTAEEAKQKAYDVWDVNRHEVVHSDDWIESIEEGK